MKWKQPMNETSKLRLFIDTTDITIWQRVLPMGLFYGITTNPSILFKENVPCTVPNLANLAENAFKLNAQEIHLQVWGEDTESMLAVGREIAAIDPRVSIKVPMTEPGILCARKLVEAGHKVTLTAVHDANQVLVAIAMGATYAAPYLGRMNDAGLNGHDELLAMQQMINHMNSPLRLLSASIRQLSDLSALARNGVDTFTLLPALVDQLLENPLTDRAATDFEEKAQASLSEN